MISLAHELFMSEHCTLTLNSANFLLSLSCEFDLCSDLGFMFRFYNTYIFPNLDKF